MFSTRVINMICVLAGAVLLLLTAVETHAGSWGYDGHRIAISADGNSAPDDGHRWKTGDPDDWGGTPAALAMIAKLGMQDVLVHYSYNNFIEAPAGPDDENQMKIGVEGSVARWGYEGDRFFDVTTHLKDAKDHLAAELAKSSADDPLYFVHMGPAEFLYQVVEQVVDGGDAESLSHVYVISHSGYNDNHLRRDTHHTLTEAIDYSGGRLNYRKIKDQNAKWARDVLWNSGKDFSPWYWLRDHRDAGMRWLYERMLVNDKGVADISDAGMVYWLLVGDENGSPSKFKAFIGDGIDSGTLESADGANEKTERTDAIRPGTLVLVEAEDAELIGDWERIESEEASGGAYLRYAGKNRYRVADDRHTLSLKVPITVPGTYTVKWYMRQPVAAEGDKANDVWIDFPDAVQKAGGGEVRGFHKFYGRSKDDFGLNGVLDRHEGHSWLNVTFDEPGE
ncbi:MAG: hypothetical protein AAGJ97_12715, partial [Planctomycetota bacterium]